MRKRRRLADKLTIMVCAVLVAVSAFFYAPMEVDAEENYDISIDYNFGVNSSAFSTFNTFAVNEQLPNRSIVDGLDADTYYSVHLSGDYIINANYYLGLRDFCLKYGDIVLKFVHFIPEFASNNKFSIPIEGDFVAKGSDFSSQNFYVNYRFVNVSETIYLDISLNLDVVSVSPLFGDESLSYEQGYNAGYSAGEQVGESNGYSNGYSDGFEAGEQSGYDSGFQAGQDSVDTQSYYDMGYSAGYDAGYLSGYDDGYDDGYDAGWQAYEDKISGWGADTSDYPILVYDNSLSNLKLFCDVKTDYPQVAYGDYYLPQFNFNVDPNHTYKLVFNSSQYTFSSAYFSGNQRADLMYNLGSFELPWNVGESFAFVQGSSFTSNVRLQSYIYSSIADGSSSGQAVITLNSLNVKVYDYGPSGNTQNHISNQTDQLTGGFNDSQGNSVNNDFSAGLNDFETAEDSLFATATTGMKDFTFFDLSSVPAMLTGMSFVGSVMTGWFNQAGGASGVGIVLSILFSIMLVAMVLGLYRWYQSKGGKD